MNQVWKSRTVWMEEPGPGCSLSRLYSFGKRESVQCSSEVSQCSMGGKYIQCCLCYVTNTGCDSDSGLRGSWQLESVSSTGGSGETDIEWCDMMWWQSYSILTVTESATDNRAECFRWLKKLPSTSWRFRLKKLTQKTVRMLEQVSDFYNENPMMVTSAFVLLLTYIYYRIRVVNVPILFCNKNNNLGK